MMLTNFYSIFWNRFRKSWKLSYHLQNQLTLQNPFMLCTFDNTGRSSTNFSQGNCKQLWHAHLARTNLWHLCLSWNLSFPLWTWVLYRNAWTPIFGTRSSQIFTSVRTARKRPRPSSHNGSPRPPTTYWLCWGNSLPSLSRSWKTKWIIISSWRWRITVTDIQVKPVSTCIL